MASGQGDGGGGLGPEQPASYYGNAPNPSQMPGPAPQMGARAPAYNPMSQSGFAPPSAPPLNYSVPQPMAMQPPPAAAYPLQQQEGMARPHTMQSQPQVMPQDSRQSSAQLQPLSQPQAAQPPRVLSRQASLQQQQQTFDPQQPTGPALIGQPPPFMPQQQQPPGPMQPPPNQAQQPATSSAAAPTYNPGLNGQPQRQLPSATAAPAYTSSFNWQPPPALSSQPPALGQVLSMPSLGRPDQERRSSSRGASGVAQLQQPQQPPPQQQQAPAGQPMGPEPQQPQQQPPPNQPTSLVQQPAAPGQQQQLPPEQLMGQGRQQPTPSRQPMGLGQQAQQPQQQPPPGQPMGLAPQQQLQRQVAAELERPASRGVLRQLSMPSTPERSSREASQPQLSRQHSLPSSNPHPLQQQLQPPSLSGGPVPPGWGYRIQGKLERVDEGNPETKDGAGLGGQGVVAGGPIEGIGGGAPASGRKRWSGGDTGAAGGDGGGDKGRTKKGSYSDDSGSADDGYRHDQRGKLHRGGDGRKRDYGGRRRAEPDSAAKGRRRRSYDSGQYTPDFTDDDDISNSYHSPPKRDKYTGDISAWGNRRVSDFYDDKTNSESNFTMSSGLSPRDTRPREREFDMEAAKKTLMYNAGMYGRAQAMRREGNAPAAMGIVDDLPNRFAFEQLNALSGMATKVQDAINHNKALFQQRMWLEDSAILRKCLHAWRATRFGNVQKQQVLLRAVQRIRRGCMSRAFFAWKERFHIVDKNLAMKRKVAATIARGLLKRTFLEWRKLEQERWWKNQYAMRDETIHMLERKIGGYERRPIVILRKRLTSKVLNAWCIQAEARRCRRTRAERGIRFLFNSQYVKAWNTWVQLVEQNKYHHALLVKVTRRMQNMHIASAFNKWCELIGIKRGKEQRRSKALRFWYNHTMAIAWRTWLGFVDWRREKKKIISRWMHPLQAKAFRSWYIGVQERKRHRLMGNRILRRMLNANLARAFFTWLNLVEERKVDDHMSTKEELAIKVRDMQEENERLRRDNERFVRLIDSGEWGRGRVSELVSAGEILKGERDALLKLIQSMRREYEAVQTAKGTQEDEMRALKDRMLLGGAARNRMLVKGGSAFNGLMRAMKQDLVEGGAGAAATRRDPNALYEIDKLSMDKVTVFPDGELSVDAVASVPGTAAFHRPISAGRALPHGSTTLGPNMSSPPHPMRMPPEFTGGVRQGGGMGRPLSATPLRPAGRANLGEVTAARPSAGSASLSSRDHQRVLNTLQNLTPAQVERLEATLRASPHVSQQQPGAGGMPRPMPAARPP